MRGGGILVHSFTHTTHEDTIGNGIAYPITAAHAHRRPRARTPTVVAQDLAQSREAGLAQAPERTQLTGRQRFVVAVTFFSMFFGAGNLIFPPLVGALSGRAAVPALVGFTISAVGLPILGVIVVARAGGFAHLSARVSRHFSLILGVAIMLTIGPLFAIPRTASTSFEMAVVPFLPVARAHGRNSPIPWCSSPSRLWWPSILTV